MNTAQLSWWNTLPQNIDPTFFTVFGFPIRWYGLMYLAAFYTCYKLHVYYIKKDKLNFSMQHLENYAAWLIGGILLGGRLGYVFFYNFDYYISHPTEILLPVKFVNGSIQFTGISGMSYHGGLIGATVGASYYVLKNKIGYWMASNLAFTTIPLGYTWGRIGNFLNGELYGRATDAPIGMLFPTDRTEQLRHPSQLYEAFSEGILLFGVILLARKHNFFKNHIMAVYIFGYGFFRFIVEYFREPDAHLPLEEQFLHLSRGQLLCVGMMLTGIGFAWWRRNRAYNK
jgi:phosphatidylglycerol:prolipoprotein diacylglycerol transferase